MLADVRFITRENEYNQDQRLSESLENILNWPSNNSYYNLLKIPIKKSLGISLKKSLEYMPTSNTLFLFPVQITIKRIEVELGSGDLQTKSFLRQVSSNRRASEYLFSTIIEGGRSLGGSRIKGDIALRGILDKSLVLTSTFTGIHFTQSIYIILVYAYYNIYSQSIVNFKVTQFTQIIHFSKIISFSL